MNSSCEDIEKPILPPSGVDGQQICDKYGNRWEYKEKLKKWIIKGVVYPQEIVSEKNDGLITPEIYNRLQEIREYFRDNKVRTLKLAPGVDAYWYYFRAGNKLFRFRSENDNVLRIEVDKGRIYQILLKEICPGTKGATGPKGPKGPPGRQASPELCYVPFIIGNRLDFAIFTPTPHLFERQEDTPDISVRLYNVDTRSLTPNQQTNQITGLISQFSSLRNDPNFKNLQESEGLCEGPLNDVYTTSLRLSSEPIITILVHPQNPDIKSIDIRQDVVEDLRIDVQRTMASIKYDPFSRIICGSIFRQRGEWESGLCLKSMQRGIAGDKGDPGACAVSIVECPVEDTNIYAKCPIISIRADCDSDILYTECSDIVLNLCFRQIRGANLPRLVDHIITKPRPIDNLYASVEVTTEECKRICTHRFELRQQYDPGSLDLVSWQPQSGCAGNRHVNKVEFEWISKTTLPIGCPSQIRSEGFAWLDTEEYPIAPLLSNDKYPYEAFSPKPPSFQTTEADCRDEGFYCDNVQDGLCPAIPEPPTEPPEPTEELGVCCSNTDRRCSTTTRERCEGQWWPFVETRILGGADGSVSTFTYERECASSFQVKITTTNSNNPDNPTILIQSCSRPPTPPTPTITYGSCCTSEELYRSINVPLYGRPALFGSCKECKPLTQDRCTELRGTWYSAPGNTGVIPRDRQPPSNCYSNAPPAACSEPLRACCVPQQGYHTVLWLCRNFACRSCFGANGTLFPVGSRCAPAGPDGRALNLIDADGTRKPCGPTAG
jgi:hypothetical protein